MHPCPLSITYRLPYHNPTPPPPWATRSTTLTSANRSPTQCHNTCLPSALYNENRDSSVKRTPLQSARHHWMWSFAHSSRLRRRTAVRSRPPMRTTSNADGLPWDGFWQFVQNSWLCKPIVVSSCPGGWSQTILEVKMLDVEVLGWCGYMWSAVVRQVGCTTKFSETPLEMAYGRAMNI